MKKVVIFGVAAVLLLMVSATVQPANATCAASRSFVSTYIYTPGVCVDGAGTGPCDVSGTSVTDDFAGQFWHVGNQNPSEGLGNDSDGFPAIPNWVAPYAGYPVVVAGDWSTDQRIDGCIDVPQPGGPAAKCMAAAFTDIDLLGNAVFAITIAPANAGGDYDFGGPINLAPLPALTIINSVRAGGGTGVQIQAILEAAGLEAGLYLNITGGCADVTGGAVALIQGYRLRYQTVPRGAAPPPSGGWTDCGSGVTPLGQPGTCSVPTPNDVDVFVSYSLVIDGGFEAGVTGDESTRIQGGPNVAVPEPRIQIRQGGKTSVRQK